MGFSVTTIFQGVFLLLLLLFLVYLVLIVFMKKSYWAQAIGALVLAGIAGAVAYFSANGDCSQGTSDETCPRAAGCKWNEKRKRCAVPVMDALTQFNRFPKRASAAAAATPAPISRPPAPTPFD